MFKNLSLRFRLALLVAGTTLPLILFAGGLVYLHHVEEREAAFDRVLETVRGMRIVLDSEVRSMTAGLQVLALSRALQRDDLEGFRTNVEAFLSQYPAGTNVSLADAEGRQLFNSRQTAGAALPQVGRATLPQVFDSGEPVYSNLFRGSVSGEQIVVIDVPVHRDGKVVYSLAFNAPLSTFQRIIDQQQPTPDWTIAIFDRSGVNFARVPNPEQTVGRHASPTLLPALLTRREAKVFTTSLEGVALLTAFTRSPLTGWSVAAGTPVALVTAPLWRTLAATALIGLVLLVVGLGFAIRMARRIAQGEALQQLMVNELNHRVKNTLATVQSIASHTFRESPAAAEAKENFEARLIALGRAHNLLSEAQWVSADMREIVEGTFEPYGLKGSARLHVSGPRTRVDPRCALILSMLLHELTTNAVKYGALANDTGEIHVSWKAHERDAGKRLELRWREVGGPAVRPPSRKGFGTRLIEQTLAQQLGGHAAIEYRAEGVICTLDCPYV